MASTVDTKRYWIWTVGCQMNKVDSDRVAETMRARGYLPAEREEDADIVVLNSCAVRESAERRVSGKLGNLQQRKQERPETLLVLTGCGHAGIVNICRYARALTKERPLYAVMGGFHLNGPVFEPLIPRVLDDLSAMTPSVVVPAHCTGWRAQHAIGARFGEAFIPNTVGTRFEL